MLKQLDSASGTGVDITSEYGLYSDSLSSTDAYLCGINLALTGLDGTGGIFEVTISAGSYVQPKPRTILFSTDTSCRVQFTDILLPAAAILIIKIKSPNAADTSVDYSLEIYDLMPAPTNFSNMDVNSNGRVAIQGGGNGAPYGV
jgi:hypothetical protein